MTLPEIVLPKIVLPFDVPVLMHPVAVHFLIALPVVVLLLELMNLMMKKKAVGGISFFLIVLTMLAAATAYFTGLVDGKEAYPALADAAKLALTEHKLLGTYVLLLSALIFFLKFLAMTGNKILKILYILMLLVFVAILFKQGKEGGELVYEHGLNVAQVSAIQNHVDELSDELDEAKDEIQKAKKVTPVATVEKVAPEEEMPKKEVADTKEEANASASVSPLESTGVETLFAPSQQEVEAPKVEVPVEVKSVETALEAEHPIAQ